MSACLRWLLLVSASAACAEGPPVEPWQVRAELQIVHLDAQRAVPLIARFTDDAPGAGEELRQLLANGSATLVAHLIARPKNEVSQEVSQTQEIKYPTTFSPFEPTLMPVRKAGEPPASAPIPISAFERRESGHIFEFYPFVHPGGRLISVQVHLNIADFAGMQRFESGVQADGTRLYFEQPVFYSRENATSVIVRAGTPFLLGCCKLESNKRVAELHVLTTHARRLDGPVPRRSGKLQPTSDGTQQPAPTLPCSQTRIELHRFIVPAADGLKWRGQLLDPEKVEGAFANLLAETQSGHCELAEILSVPIRDKTPGVFSNSHEQRYPTEFRFRGMTDVPIFDCPPTCFVKRHVGESLSAEVKDDHLAGHTGLSFDFETVTHHGFIRWPTGPNEPAETAQTYCYRPDFTTQRTKLTGTLLDGQRTLFRFHKLPAPDGRVEIVLIRAVTEHFTNEPTL